MVKTDLGKVIGCYWPEKWEDTTNMIDGNPGWKNIISGKAMPFLFYFLDGIIELIKHRENKTPRMKSGKDYPIVLAEGMVIYFKE